MSKSDIIISHLCSCYIKVQSMSNMRNVFFLILTSKRIIKKLLQECNSVMEAENNIKTETRSCLQAKIEDASCIAILTSRIAKQICSGQDIYPEVLLNIVHSDFVFKS